METDRILRKLEAVRAGDPAHQLFGANGHRYRMNATLSESQVEDFECRHQIRLPADYREFLLTCGDGGAGPYYGVFPLGLIDSVRSEFEDWREGDGFAGVLRRDFPHKNAWCLPDERYTQPAFVNQAAQDNWQQELDDELWSAALTNGAFPICHQGCAIRNLLVVSGDERSHIWIDGRASDGDIVPEVDSRGNRHTFSSWYETWLDECLGKLK